jgi:adenylate kinase
VAEGNAAKRLVLLGAPGSGKGTQASLLAENLGIPAISTGEMLRQAVAAGSPLGKTVETVMASGTLVDDETMAAVVEQRLASADASEGFILDGYPRTLGQADTLAAILERRGWELDSVIHIQVPEAELVKRTLARKRADDKEEVIRQRLEVYLQQTQPLIDHYRRASLLRAVDGHQTIENVSKSIVEALGEAA